MGEEGASWLGWRAELIRVEGCSRGPRSRGGVPALLESIRVRAFGLEVPSPLRLHYTRLFPDPRFLLFVLQNISGYKNAVECLLQ